MSLDVPAAILERAEAGEVDDADFAEVVRTSLPYAWEVVSRVAGELESGSEEYADNLVAPPDEVARGQLLRAMASDAIRGGLERHFKVKLAFQNCHRVAAFPLSAVGGETYTRFIGTRAQLLNQSPELRNC
ncbi:MULTISPECIES: SCO5389 family protein [Nocardia]|uniref:SCO5389 family protein n=1 Tax=Nocardia aurea TaxID=2144174 RepID=A0ABV3FPR0_9NOCA|nr:MULTISPECIES: SCO5389 family protein [Nocardia]